MKNRCGQKLPESHITEVAGADFWLVRLKTLKFESSPQPFPEKCQTGTFVQILNMCNTEHQTYLMGSDKPH